jgi:hypothetical protein
LAPTALMFSFASAHEDPYAGGDRFTVLPGELGSKVHLTAHTGESELSARLAHPDRQSDWDRKSALGESVDLKSRSDHQIDKCGERVMRSADLFADLTVTTGFAALRTKPRSPARSEIAGMDNDVRRFSCDRPRVRRSRDAHRRGQTHRRVRARDGSRSQMSDSRVYRCES